MQHPTPTAEPIPFPDGPQFSISTERRTRINDDLKLPQVGLAVAVNHPPGRRKPHLTIVKLPRGSSGKPPRRGVHIPVPAHMQKGAAKVSKHARQQHRDGKFGNKGKATVERKLETLNASRAEALVLAVKRMRDRATRFVGWAYQQQRAKLVHCFGAAFTRAASVLGVERLRQEVGA